MRRRALLVALGSVSTGCLSAPPSRTPTTGPPSRTSPESAEYRLTDLTVTTTTDRPSVRYVLEASAFYSAEAVEREREQSDAAIVVRDVTTIDEPAVREAVEAAGHGEWRSNSLPDGLASLVERVDFFTGLSTDDTHTHIGLTLHRLHPDRPPAVEFDASVTDQWVAPDRPGALALSLTNTGQATREVFTGTVPPFGMVFAHQVDGTGRFLLWRDYEAEGCVSFTGDGWVVCDIGIITTLDPGETVSRRYEVLPSTTEAHPSRTVPPGPGRYRISDGLAHSRANGAPSSELSFDVAFSLAPA